MRKIAAGIAAAAACAAFAGVQTDGKRVVFTATATGVTPGEAIEFFAAGPQSDHAYETLFLADDPPQAIADAIAKTGIPQGLATDPFKARLWPQGERVRVYARLAREGEKFAPLADWVEDRWETENAEDADGVLGTALRWTGGARDGKGHLVADTMSPNAIFALFTTGQSPIVLDGQHEQSVTYGRFFPAKRMALGDKAEIAVEWDGKRSVASETLEIANAADAAQLLRSLKEKHAADDLFVQLRFDNATVEEAGKIARIFQALDGTAMKLNGAAEGEFFYGAFAPDERWRAREGRVFQPFEVRVERREDGGLERKFVFVEEDWSGDGLDPRLVPHETSVKDWSELRGLVENAGAAADKLTVMFVFAPADLAVAELRGIIAAVPPRIATFYVFAE
ncbi:MAG: hypothetical protein IJ802_00095 [Kiritimatiellae bacterium]|nr:hypothetical protein [Kiritimatiellia bacterium]